MKNPDDLRYKLYCPLCGAEETLYIVSHLQAVKQKLTSDEYFVVHDNFEEGREFIGVWDEYVECSKCKQRTTINAVQEFIRKSVVGGS